MQLLLELPEISPALANVVETNPKKLRDWLIGLPSSNVIEAGRQIHDALASLNRIELAIDDRIKLLAEYETMLDLMAGGFEAEYAAAGLPVKEHAKQAAAIYRSLWLEMAMAWKVVLVNRMEKRSLFGVNGKAEPLFIQRVLNSYWRVYRICCRLYQPMPSGVWGEIHQMFRLGAKNQFLNEPATPKNHSISATYKRILLLALADPLRFAPPEQDKVVEIVESYSYLAHFQPTASLTSQAGYFLIELDTDTPPRFVGNRTIEGTNLTSVLLDTTELSRHLHKTEAAIEEKAPLAHDRAKVLVRLQILRRIIRQWTITPQRTFQRIPSSSLVDIVFGLRSVLTELSHGQILNPPQTSTPPEHHDEQETILPPPSREVRRTQWQVLNESPGGFAVHSVSVGDEQVHAGDVVALRATLDSPWLVASVRWLQVNEDNSLEMGLQVMSARAVPALISPTIGATPNYLPAVLLPEIAALKQPARIAASKGTYTPLRELSILTATGMHKVRASKLVEQQMSYDLFDYQTDQPIHV
ncbi:MAG: hypothetical protein P4L87_02410 [Formivibrio sp.]|nr:hypothetical protein [Formivibrio sp.]